MEDIAGNKMGLRRAIEIVRGGGLNEISRKKVYGMPMEHSVQKMRHF